MSYPYRVNGLYRFWFYHIMSLRDESKTNISFLISSSPPISVYARLSKNKNPTNKSLIPVAACLNKTLSFLAKEPLDSLFYQANSPPSMHLLSEQPILTKFHH